MREAIAVLVIACVPLLGGIWIGYQVGFADGGLLVASTEATCDVCFTDACLSELHPTLSDPLLD